MAGDRRPAEGSGSSDWDQGPRPKLAISSPLRIDRLLDELAEHLDELFSGGPADAAGTSRHDRHLSRELLCPHAANHTVSQAKVPLRPAPETGGQGP